VQFCNTAGSNESLVTNFNPTATSTIDWAYSTNGLSFAFNETTQQLSVGNLNAGTYEIHQILIADSMCINDTTTVTIAITQVPQVDFNSSVIEGCEPLSVTFNDLSNAQGNLTYFWDFGNGQTSTTVTGNTIVYPTPNCYTVSLTVTADNLCTVTKQKTNMICVYEIPTAAFSFAPQQVFSHEPSVQFNNLSTLNASNFWSFGDGSFSSIEEPSHDYPLGAVGDYNVLLQVTSIHGCVDTVSHFVTVKDQLLYYVPNTFTPDGDEHNNVFEAIVFAGVDQDEVSFEVYNRWGEVVFKTTDLTEGWDGTYNGLKCPEGTYAWVLRLGLSESEDVKIVNGAVNLIR
jgi:gliding motility-associated-like protein